MAKQSQRNTAERMRVLEASAGASPHFGPAFLVVGAWGLALVLLAREWVRCPIAWAFGLPCPGCGMTRAMHLLARGAVGASLAMHPLAMPATAACGLLAWSMTRAAFHAGSPAAFHRRASGRVALQMVTGVAAASFVLWLARAFGACGGPVLVSAP